MGAFSTAAEPFERILALGRTTGDPRLESLATWSLGVVEAMGGDLDAAIAACGRALDLARETSTRILASGWLGYALLEQGDAPRAIEALARAVRPSPEAWLSPDWGWFSILLGEAYALGGHPEAAHEAILAGLTAAGEARSTVGTGLGERALGRLALAQSRLADAERHLQKALDTFGGIEAPYYQARTLLDLAAAGAAGGALDIARARLQEARRLFSGLRTGRWLKQTDALATTLGLEPA
jgi:tetratricopeptide (TPR) repeat protein